MYSERERFTGAGSTSLGFACVFLTDMFPKCHRNVDRTVLWVSDLIYRQHETLRLNRITTKIQTEGDWKRVTYSGEM